MVPAVTDVPLDGDESHTRFDQATGQQQALSDPVAAVGGSQRVGFLCQVEGVLGLPGRDHREGTGLELVVCSGKGQLLFGASLESVDGFQQATTTRLAVVGDRAGRIEGVDGIAAAVRVALDDERIVGPAQVTAVAGGTVTRAGDRADLDVGRCLAGALFLLPGQHGPEAGWHHVSIQRVAAHQVMITLAVSGRVGVHRADHRELVGTGGHVRHQFAEFQSRNVGGDRVEFPSDFRRCQGFQVVHVDVAGATEHPQQDAVDRTAGRIGSLGGCLLSP